MEQGYCVMQVVLLTALVILALFNSVECRILDGSGPNACRIKGKGNRIGCRNSKAHVIGGEVVQPDKYKYIASLRLPPGSMAKSSKEDISGDHYCSGVLVANDIVVTAAHCITDTRLRNVTLHLNRFNRDGADDGRFEEYSSVEHVVHPKFKRLGETFDYDIALLVLDHSSGIEPVRIVESMPKGKNIKGVVLGWGITRTGSSGALSDKLLSASVPLVPQHVCRELYDNSSPITKTMLCAGKEGADACQSDSGGPLLINGTLAGIVSWGSQCGTERPGVYCNIFFLRGWIQKQIAIIHKSQASSSDQAQVQQKQKASTPKPKTRQKCSYVGGQWVPTGCKRPGSAGKRFSNPSSA